MARKKNPTVEAEKKEKAFVKFMASDMDDAFDALDDTDDSSSGTDYELEPEPVDDDDVEDFDDRVRGTPAFIGLQNELNEIRLARKKLTEDMEAPELDRDERDTLKARGTLLDSRERSAREELKLFHKNELTQLGQIRKVRLIIEMTIDPKTGKPFEGRF